MRPLGQKRTIKGIWIRPSRQIKFLLYVTASAILILIGALASFVALVSKVLNSLEVSYGLEPQVVEFIRSQFSSALLVTLLIAGALIAVAGMLTVLISHRLYGPIVPLQRHISELINGNFSSRVTLRKRDELIELMESLNNLAASLEKMSMNGVAKRYEK